MRFQPLDRKKHPAVEARCRKIHLDTSCVYLTKADRIAGMLHYTVGIEPQSLKAVRPDREPMQMIYLADPIFPSGRTGTLRRGQLLGESIIS